MYKKVRCTCEVVVLLIKPNVFLTFSLSSESLDLKVPIVEIRKLCCRRHFRNEKGTGVEMLLAIIYGIVTYDALVSYWLIFFLFLVTVPEVFAKVNSAQVLSRF